MRTELDGGYPVGVGCKLLARLGWGGVMSPLFTASWVFGGRNGACRVLLGWGVVVEEPCLACHCCCVYRWDSGGFAASGDVASCVGEISFTAVVLAMGRE